MEDKVVEKKVVLIGFLFDIGSLPPGGLFEAIQEEGLDLIGCNGNNDASRVITEGALTFQPIIFAREPLPDGSSFLPFFIDDRQKMTDRGLSCPAPIPPICLIPDPRVIHPKMVEQGVQAVKSYGAENVTVVHPRTTKAEFGDIVRAMKEGKRLVFVPGLGCRRYIDPETI